MAITIRRGKLFSEPHMVVYLYADDMELDNKVNETIPANSERMGYLKEKSAKVKKASKLKSVINLGHEKGKKVEASLTKIHRPPPPLHIG